MSSAAAWPRIEGFGVERALGQGLGLQLLVVPGTQPRPVQGRLFSLTAVTEAQPISHQRSGWS